MIDSGSVKWTWRWFSPFPDLVFLSATFNIYIKRLPSYWRYLTQTVRCFWALWEEKTTKSHIFQESNTSTFASLQDLFTLSRSMLIRELKILMREFPPPSEFESRTSALRISAPDHSVIEVVYILMRLGSRKLFTICHGISPQCILVNWWTDVPTYWWVI
jgi:hypothetical protein